MIIGINASALTLEHKTGVEKYTEHIIRALIKRADKKHQFKLYSPIPLSGDFAAHQVVLKSHGLPWTQVRLSVELMRHRPDVFFQPSYMLPPVCPCPSVTTVHDIAWKHFPQGYSQDQTKKLHLAIDRIIKLKSTIIVPSIDTKKDLMHFFKINQNNINVIPEALVELPVGDINLHPNIAKMADRDIVLSVGRLEARKNTLTLVKAFRVLVKDHLKNSPTKPVLVLIGQAGFGADEIFAEVNKAKNDGIEILVLNNVDDSALSCWMSVAKMLVYPSLFEGFGLPILQAFAAKIPVITSKTSAMPEVGGGAVAYLNNPKDEDELAILINNLLFSNAKREILIDKGQTRLNDFSWEKAADQTLAVLLAAGTKNS
ncbi:MAG: glycosyltransferase family 1 protein [Patescibacteria group bacterium]|jgi:glycosyltransferase involved in cell wall biosynthesis